MHLDSHSCSVQFPKRLTVCTLFAGYLVDTQSLHLAPFAPGLVPIVMADVGPTAALLAVALRAVMSAERDATAVSALGLDKPV
jgi:hypothetical protein